MTKIGTKLLLGSAMFICILILHTILGQLTTKQATESHNTLTKKIAPAVKLLSDIRMDNKELFLLVKNKVVDNNNGTTSNRIRQIIDVGLPYYISNLIDLKQSLELTDPKNKNIDSIAEYASKSMELIKKINILLLTSKDYEDTQKMEMITNLLDNQLSIFSIEIDNRISFLQIEYNKELENNFSELSNSLQDNSKFFLWTSLIFISFGLIITYKNTMSIVKPINALLESVENIQAGNYENKVAIKGIDELSILGNAFNQMSDTLHTSFKQIKLKNKELEHFVYIASHDLQEPLRTINSFTELFVKDYNDKLDQKATTYMGFISQASTRMSLLVKGLLDYSRIGVVKKLTMVNCNDMLKGIEVDLSALISDKNATLEIDVLPKILAYQTELRLLFQNIINNAIKFHRPNVSPIVKIKAEEHNHFWKFMISDNGIGIQENKKEKIFAMFQRLNTQKDYEGTGIGLAHCSKIIEMHGGTIKVDSKINYGSTFSITISKKLFTTKEHYIN